MARNIRCHWCGVSLSSSRDENNDARFTRDHFPARIHRRDFPELPHGVVFACFGCNNARGVDDSWIPYSWWSDEARSYIDEHGTAGVIELLSRHRGVVAEGRQVLTPELYDFVLTGDRYGGRFPSDDSVDLM